MMKKRWTDSVGLVTLALLAASLIAPGCNREGKPESQAPEDSTSASDAVGPSTPSDPPGPTGMNPHGDIAGSAAGSVAAAQAGTAGGIGVGGRPGSGGTFGLGGREGRQASGGTSAIY